jgi:multidrug transporter EmrE-like cation transporter
VNPYLMLGISIVSEVVATSALRASEGFTRLGPSLLVVVGYGTAFFLLSHVLKALPLGLAYAVWSGVGTTLTVLIGWLYFRDTLTGVALLGIVLIVVGVGVLNLGGAARH